MEDIPKIFLVLGNGIILENREGFRGGEGIREGFSDYIIKVRVVTPHGL